MLPIITPPPDDTTESSLFARVPWRLPIAVSGEGIYIILEDGQRVIDAVGGAAVAAVGANHPAVISAMKEQIDRISYVYSMQFSNEPAEELGRFLVESGKGAFKKCAFASGGTEAMEGVLKTARQYYAEIGQPQRKHFIGRKMAFHGNSIATLSLGYHPTRRAPYADILDDIHFHHVSPAYACRYQAPGETEEGYVERLRKELEDMFIELGPDTVIGFVAETVVGATTGCVPAPKGYFKAMKEVCDKYGALFILDEVMSGMGRMGTIHAWESFGDNASPDLQAVAKGLGGGYAAIGAILMSERVVDGLTKGGCWKHGHTYQQNPLACAASLAVQKVIESENLLENCRKQGAYLEKRLRECFKGPNCPVGPFVYDIRGGGLFWGVEFDFSSSEGSTYNFKGDRFAMLLQAQCLKNGLAILAFTGGANPEGTAGDHVILSPAYTVTQDEVEKIVELLVRSSEEVLKYHTV